MSRQVGQQLDAGRFVDLPAPVYVKGQIPELLSEAVHLHLDMQLSDLGLAFVKSLVGLFSRLLGAPR